MVFCAVVGCGSNKVRDGKSKRFFRFPSEIGKNKKVCTLSKKRRQAWIRALKRENLSDSILKYQRVCSRHFLSGQPSALADEDNVDWIPHINMGYAQTEITNTLQGSPQRGIRNRLRLDNIKEDSVKLYCFGRGCFHNTKDHTCEFFPFPKDVSLWPVWHKLVGREDSQPRNHTRVCSCHFIDKKVENCPTLFRHNHGKTFVMKIPKYKLKPSCPYSTIKFTVKLDSDQVTKLTENALESLPERIHCPPVYPSAAKTSNYIKSSKLSGKSDSCTQTVDQPPSKEIIHLKSELVFVYKEVERIRAEAQTFKKFKLKYDYIKENEEIITLYTGFRSCNSMNSFLEVIRCIGKDQIEFYKMQSLTVEDQILLVLMKLRHNYHRSELAYLFGICHRSVNNIFHNWLKVFLTVFYHRFVTNAVTTFKENDLLVPQDLPHTCRLIIDFAEVCLSEINREKVPHCGHMPHKTLKSLIGIAPNGLIMLLSDLYQEVMPNREIIELNRSALVKLVKSSQRVLEEDDDLRGKKSYDVLLGTGDIEEALDHALVMREPNSSATFGPDNNNSITMKARARVQVDKAMRRIKNFKICEEISAPMKSIGNSLLKVCAAISNIQLFLDSELNNRVYKKKKSKKLVDVQFVDELNNMQNATQLPCEVEEEESIAVNDMLGEDVTEASVSGMDDCSESESAVKTLYVLELN